MYFCNVYAKRNYTCFRRMTKNCGRSARWNVKYHSIVSSLNIRHRSSGVHALARSVSCLSLNERNGNYCDVDACIFQALRSSSEKVSLWRSYCSVLINQRGSATLKFPLPTCDTVFWVSGSVFAYSLSPGSCIGLRCYNRLVVSSYGWSQATAGIRDFNWTSVAFRLLSLDSDTVSMVGRYWRFGGTRYLKSEVVCSATVLLHTRIHDVVTKDHTACLYHHGELRPQYAILLV